MLWVFKDVIDRLQAVYSIHINDTHWQLINCLIVISELEVPNGSGLIILQLVEFGSPKKHSANQQTYVNPALLQISDKVTKLADKVDQQEDKSVVLNLIVNLI